MCGVSTHVPAVVLTSAGCSTAQPCSNFPLGQVSQGAGRCSRHLACLQMRMPSQVWCHRLWMRGLEEVLQHLALYVAFWVCVNRVYKQVR